MSEPVCQEVTQLLLAWGQGDEEALVRLTPLVHQELHRLAKRYMSKERHGHILQTTALLNEAYLKLVDCRRVNWQGRAHLLSVSARLMRRILVDYARARRYEKRGGKAQHVSLEEAINTPRPQNMDLLAIHDALDSLARLDLRKSEVVELRFFAGLSVEETAEVMKLSPRTVIREWSLAQAWLHAELTRESGSDS